MSSFIVSACELRHLSQPSLGCAAEDGGSDAGIQRVPTTGRSLSVVIKSSTPFHSVLGRRVGQL